MNNVVLSFCFSPAREQSSPTYPVNKFPVAKNVRCVKSATSFLKFGIYFAVDKRR